MSPLQPALDPEVYAFCELPLGSKLPFRPLFIFEEAEALTIVLPAYQAKSLGYTSFFESRRLTLTLETSLSDVGLMSKIAAAFAAAHIPCNSVSALHHDHFFVPEQHAKSALQILDGITWP